MLKLNYVASLILLYLAATINLNAQIQNRLGVEEDIFEPYSKCRLDPTNPNNIAVADSLYAIGDQKNDYKIKTLALNAALPAYFSIDDFDNMERVISEIKDIQKSHQDISDIYFAALYSYCQYLTYMDRASDSFVAAKDMLRQATSMNDSYALMLSYRTMAFIYQCRSNPSQAVECYLKALDYCNISNAPVEENPILVQLAQEQVNSGDFDGARKTLSKIEYRTEGNPTLSMQYNFVNAYLGDVSGDVEQFWKYYELIRDNELYPSIIGDEDRCLVEIDYLVSKRELNKAENLAKNHLYGMTQHQILSNIYYEEGLYKQAYDESNTYNQLKDSLEVVLRSEDIAIIDAQFENSELRHEALTFKSKVRTYALSIALAVFIIISILSLLNRARELRHKYALETKNAELQKAQKETEIALQKAKESDAIKTRFLQNMSHEIRTPLNAVVGFSQLLTLPDGFNSEKEKSDYSEYILNNSEMLTMLVDDIISLSDVENGNYKINKSFKCCNDIIRYAEKSVQHRVNPNVTLTWNSIFDDAYIINTDERRVQQVLINLLTNACKHTESGTITISCLNDTDENFIRFEVTDTGEGVPADKAEKIFERFFKVDEFKQGAGIGLNICKIISEKLGGNLYLDTTYSGGAKFIFSIPKE